MLTPPKNPILGIIGGRGTLGAVFARAFAAAGYRVLISGRRPDGKTVLSNAELIEKADVIFVSVPLTETAQVLAEIVPQLRANQLVADFTSVKSAPVAQLLQSKAEVVGLHPMFGAAADLRGLSIFACPVRAPRWWPWLRKLLRQLELKIHVVSPAQHDARMAVQQATPHLLSLAFANLLSQNKLSPAKVFESSAPSAQLLLLITGRLLAQDLQMYTEIQTQNPAAADAVAQIAAELTRLADLIQTGAKRQLHAELQNAAQFFGAWSAAAERVTDRLFPQILSLIAEGDCHLARRKSSGSETSPRSLSGAGSVEGSRTNFNLYCNKSGHLTGSFDSTRLRARSAQDDNLNHKKTDLTVAVLGPGTQTELAAAEFLQRQKIRATPIFYPTNDAVAAALTAGKAQFAVLPLENYAVGPVRETVKNLFAAGGELQILATLARPIHHALLGSATALSHPTRIFAHPQARAQCQQFLQTNFPGVEVVETPHTGESVARAAADGTALALGPAELAAQYQVKVLQKEVEDDPNNRTRFVLLGRPAEAAQMRGTASGTALAFFFAANKAGQLAVALTIFARHGVSLARLESVPVVGKPGEFFFFTECAAVGQALETALAELRQIATVVNFGSYVTLPA